MIGRSMFKLLTHRDLTLHQRIAQEKANKLERIAYAEGSTPSWTATHLSLAQIHWVEVCGTDGYQLDRRKTRTP